MLPNLFVLTVLLHEQVIDPLQHALVIEVVEDDTLGALAVQLQPDVVAGFEAGPHPCRHVDERASLHRAGQRLLSRATLAPMSPGSWRSISTSASHHPATTTSTR